MSNILVQFMSSMGKPQKSAALTNGHNIPYADIVFNLSKHLL
jgi:hypothetical protein